MKNYGDYNKEDFLLDESFRNWIINSDDELNQYWGNVVRNYPETEIVMHHARELLLLWSQKENDLSEDELKIEVDRIMANTETLKVNGRVRSFNKSIISVAASILVVFGIAWAIFYKAQTIHNTSNDKAYTSKVEVPMREIQNTTDKKMKVVLPEGSVIELSPSSQLSFREEFIQNKKREVYLSGEAFFDVTKDPLNPFFVYAHGLVTRVVGTSFFIKTTESNVEVVVKSGRVSVLALKDIDNQKDRNTELLLIPNQQAIFSTKDNVISKSISSNPLELILPKTEQAFVFMDQPIENVFGTLERIYGIPIIYDLSVMKNCSLRVKLANEPFFTKLDIICKTIGAGYRVSDGQVVISSEGCE